MFGVFAGIIFRKGKEKKDQYNTKQIGRANRTTHGRKGKDKEELNKNNITNANNKLNLVTLASYPMQSTQFSLFS